MHNTSSDKHLLNQLLNRGLSASSTTTTSNRLPVELVEVVDRLPVYTWDQNQGVRKNSIQLGKLLAALPTVRLYQPTEGDGLVQVDGAKVRRITTANELGALISRHVRIDVVKNGKYHGERIDQTTLTQMLLPSPFLDSFPQVNDVVATPVVLSNDTVATPGYNALDSVLYLGAATGTASSMDATNKFLDVIEWASPADRANAVAAWLTIPFRLRWLGGKPFVLVTANKSHAGKTTVCDFINIDQTPSARVEYDPFKDWPMQNSVFNQLMAKPEIGIISFDNVKSRGAALISSGYLESFVTASEVVIGKATSVKTRWAANKFVVMLNSNEGSLSIDLLNRSLPIRLAPTGDVTQRKSPIGNPKHDYLPAHRAEIIAERQGMIDRWVAAGKPLDKSVAHYPMGPWAMVMGGILEVNGVTGFLQNYGATRCVADPVREAIGILAFSNGGHPKRAADLVKCAIREGVAKTLLPGVEVLNPGSAERALGHLFRAYVGESFTVNTVAEHGWEQITYRLEKRQARFDEKCPHYRYVFTETGREHLTEEPLGQVLELPGIEGMPAK